MKLLIVLTLLANFIMLQTWWETPQITNSCNEVNIQWSFPPPTNFESPIGYIVVNGKNYTLQYAGNGVYTVYTGIDSGNIDSAFVLTTNGEWLGVVETPYTIKCNKAYFPFIK